MWFEMPIQLLHKGVSDGSWWNKLGFWLTNKCGFVDLVIDGANVNWPFELAQTLLTNVT